MEIFRFLNQLQREFEEFLVSKIDQLAISLDGLTCPEKYIFVKEARLLTKAEIDQLRRISKEYPFQATGDI